MSSWVHLPLGESEGCRSPVKKDRASHAYTCVGMSLAASAAAT